MKVSKTLFFMFRNPIPFIVQLICWFLYFALQVMSEVPPAGRSLLGEVSFMDRSLPGIVRLAKTSLHNLPGSLENFAVIVSIIFDEIIIEVITTGGWIFIPTLAFIIGYREASGNLKGIAKERQTWMQWYDQQQEVISGDDALGEAPSKLEDTQVNSYFRKAQRTVFSMVRNPKHFILHFACWLSPFVLLFVVEWAVTPEIARDFVKGFPPIAIFFAIVAFYQLLPRDKRHRQRDR